MYEGSGDASADARQMEQDRRKKIDAGMGRIDQTFGQFDDKFYADREKAYENYAQPELSTQALQTRKQLSFALSRSGLLDSGSAVDRNALLDREVAKREREMADTAKGQANELRGQVENQRTNLTSQLEASADPAATATQATAAAGQFRSPGAFGPIGNLFSDFSQSYIANQNARIVNPNVPSYGDQITGGAGGWTFGGGGNPSVQMRN